MRIKDMNEGYSVLTKTREFVKIKELKDVIIRVAKELSCITKFDSIEEAIEYKNSLLKYSFKIAKETGYSCKDLSFFCSDCLKKTACLIEERHLAWLAKSYLNIYKSISEICATIQSYEKKDFAVITESMHVEDILNFKL